MSVAQPARFDNRNKLESETPALCGGAGLTLPAPTSKMPAEVHYDGIIY